MAKRSEGSAASRGRAMLARALPLLERPGLLGWLGILFGACGLWFVASAAALGWCASQMTEEHPGSRAAAERSRWLGFGERFVEPVLRRSPGDGPRALPDPLRPLDLARARAAALANARASWVFGALSLVVCASLWALRSFDPSLRRSRVSSRE